MGGPVKKGGGYGLQVKGQWMRKRGAVEVVVSFGEIDQIKRGKETRKKNRDTRGGRKKKKKKKNFRKATVGGSWENGTQKSRWERPRT